MIDLGWPLLSSVKGEFPMTRKINRNYFRILGMHRRVAGAAMAFAILLAAAVVATKPAQAQSYSFGVLYSFTRVPFPVTTPGPVVLDAQGNLYMTTHGGGASGAGTVFKVDTTGNGTVLYSFTGTGGGRLKSQRCSAGRAGQPVWHDLCRRRLRRGNCVQGGYDRQRNRPLQLQRDTGRRISRSRCSAGRARQPVWHYLGWRRGQRRNGVQGGYNRPGDRAPQLPSRTERGRLSSHGRCSAGCTRQPVRHNLSWRVYSMQPAEWLRNGVQGGYDRPGDRAPQLLGADGLL